MQIRFYLLNFSSEFSTFEYLRMIWAADNGKKSFDPFSNWREQGTVAYDKLLNTPITFSLYSLILLGVGSVSPHYVIISTYFELFLILF